MCTDTRTDIQRQSRNRLRLRRKCHVLVVKDTLFWVVVSRAFDRMCSGVLASERGVDSRHCVCISGLKLE